MIHPDTELKYISEEIGYGVFATRFIPAGTIMWALDNLDRELSPVEFKNLEPVCRPMVENHTFRNRKGNYILCWDIGRYVNHSFTPNCMPTAYNFEIAICDIHPGDQITDDYGCLNIIAPFMPDDEGTERTVVYPDDLLKYHKDWDKKVKLVLGKIGILEQPLRPLIADELWEKIGLISKGKVEMDSILNNYYNEKVMQSCKNI